MIKEVYYENWKSLRDASFTIDPLTVLIGTNSSGKSNALDGLRFLNRIAKGMDFISSFGGDTTGNAIRGGAEWAALKPNMEFSLGVLIGTDSGTDYLYSIRVQTIPDVLLMGESLKRIKYTGKQKRRTYEINLFWTDVAAEGSPGITARLYNEHRGKPKECGRSKSILAQLQGQMLRQEISEGIECVISTLSSIFVLDPVPSMMRGFSQFSKGLEEDASNIAGVLAALPEKNKKQITDKITKYTSRLPERDIVRVWAEPVGLFQSDAMLYCEEKWVTGAETIIVDARSMSDGTLRFVAILTALLTRPENSQIIIEEVDNGLHPSRASLLLEILNEIGQDRNIDVLITTHNPALLDSMGGEMVPFIYVANRDLKTGESNLDLLENYESLPKMLAGGSLGDIASSGLLEQK